MARCFEFPYEDLVKPPQRGEQWEKFDFTDNLLLGYYFKNLAVLLFDKAGYEVYPFGWESLLPTLKRRLYPSSLSEVEQRIRATPDLLLRNPEDGSCSLVEVKYRTGQADESVEPGRVLTFIELHELRLYKQFWPESIVLLFTSAHNYVYAQQVGKLNEEAPVEVQFSYAEEIFTLFSKLDEQFRRKIARKVAIMVSLRREGRL